MSLKLDILNHLKNNRPDWIHGGDIERLSFKLGYMASNGLRRCRELSNSGLIEREIRGGEVWYRFKGEESALIREMREIREKNEREKEAKNFNSTAKLF